MQSTPPPDAAAEIELVKGIVAKYYSVYETRPALDAIYFMCNVDKATLDDKFRMMREELGRHGYTPIITYRKGEYLVIVGKAPQQKFRGVWVNVVMLALTLLTTIFVGTLYWQGYAGDQDNAFAAENVIMGTLFFALPIMAVLGIHEMGHYFTARKFGIPASLPFFIPYPFAIGTLGAFISIRGPIPDRKTMFYLGIAGPICGFLAAIPVAIGGLILTNQMAVAPPEAIGGLEGISIPFIYEVLAYFFPVTGDYIMHPMAMAGWVGFFLTAINLLPAGSLDGGHVARAVFGPKAQWVSYAAVFALFVLSWFYMGWIFFAILVLFLGMGHSPPLNDITPIKSGQKLLAIGAAVMMVVSFVLIPFYIIPEDHSFEATLEGSDQASITSDLAHTFEIALENNGNIGSSIFFEISPADSLEMSISYWDPMTGLNIDVVSPSNFVPLPVNSTVTTNVTLKASDPVTEELKINATLLMRDANYPEFNQTVEFNITVAPTGFATQDLIEATMSPGNTTALELYFNSSSSLPFELQLTAISPANWSAWLSKNLTDSGSSRLVITVAANENATAYLHLASPATATVGEVVWIDVELEDTGTGGIKEIHVRVTIG